MAFDLIVPSNAERLITGFIGGIEKAYCGHVYRAELYPAGWSITKDGYKLRSWDDLPKRLQTMALDAKRMLTQDVA